MGDIKRADINAFVEHSVTIRNGLAIEFGAEKYWDDIFLGLVAPLGVSINVSDEDKWKIDVPLCKKTRSSQCGHDNVNINSMPSIGLIRVTCIHCNEVLAEGETHEEINEKLASRGV